MKYHLVVICLFLVKLITILRSSQIKNFAMDILKRSSKVWVPELTANLSTMFDTIEAEVSKDGSASYLIPLQKFIFNFLTKCLVGADTASSPKIAESGYAMLDRWLALQLLPTVKIGLLQPLEEILLHSFAYPSFLVSGDYNKLYQFVKEQGMLPTNCFYLHLVAYCRLHL